MVLRVPTVAALILVILRGVCARLLARYYFYCTTLSSTRTALHWPWASGQRRDGDAPSPSRGGVDWHGPNPSGDPASRNRPPLPVVVLSPFEVSSPRASLPSGADSLPLAQSHRSLLSVRGERLDALPTSRLPCAALIHVMIATPARGHAYRLMRRALQPSSCHRGPWDLCGYVVAAGVHALEMQSLLSVFCACPPVLPSSPSQSLQFPHPTTPEGDPDFHTCDMSCR